MAKIESEKIVQNRYEKFIVRRYSRKTGFRDFVRNRLGREHVQILSKLVIEWTPAPGYTFRISNGTWGEIVALARLEPARVASNPLHQLLSDGWLS